MKVISKQKNSCQCIICGLYNEAGVKAPFYNMEDGSVMSKFRFQSIHQSYPGRVHGGLVTAMLDDMGLRALWAKKSSEEQLGVTMKLDTNYRKPVPYDTDLIGKGILVKDSPHFFTVKSEIMDTEGNVLANGTVKYIKLNAGEILQNTPVHEEMFCLEEDGVTEIVFKK